MLCALLLSSCLLPFDDDGNTVFVSPSVLRLENISSFEPFSTSLFVRGFSVRLADFFSLELGFSGTST